MEQTSRILIVGAGIAGLVLANALERLGFAPQVVDRASTLRPPGLGLALMPNGMRALARVGLDQAVLSRGSLQTRGVTLAPDGSKLGVMEFASPAAAGAPMVGLHRDALLDAFTERLRAEVRLRTTVRSLTPEGSRIIAELDDGSREEFDLVVGADGLRSGVAGLAFEGADPRYCGYRAWRTLLPLRQEDPTDVTFRVAAGAFGGSFPAGSEAMYLFLLEHGTDDLAAADGPVQVRRLAECFDPTARELADRMGDDTPVVYTPVYETVRETWVAGRVLLIGDAAHAIVPFQAQGASMAIEDAVVLAEQLAGRREIDEALATYAERRRPRVTRVGEICRFLGTAIGLEGPVEPGRLATHPGNTAGPAAAQAELWSGLEPGRGSGGETS